MEKLCIDPRDRNRAILREHFPLQTVDEIIIQIRDASVFTKLEATSGFGNSNLLNRVPSYTR